LHWPDYDSPRSEVNTRQRLGAHRKEESTFGRYSFADFRRDGPTAFGQGGGAALVSLGGTSKVRNQSLALGFDRTIGTSMTADFRLSQHGADQFFYLPDLEYGPADWDRKHSFTIATLYELPFWKTNKYLGGWQFNQSTIIQSGTPFNVTYCDAGSDRDIGPNRPNLIGNPDGPKTRDQWFNTAPIGDPNSAFGRPAVGTFGNLPRNALRGPGYWRTDASLFKRFQVLADQALELRIEVVNLFNHVNLGNPHSEIGVPGNNNANAGRITSTANFGADPQRNFQFAVKYIF